MIKEEEKDWTLDDLQKHMRINLKDSYGGAIVCAALFKMKFGFLPKIGLSGFQAEAAESIVAAMPNTPKEVTD